MRLLVTLPFRVLIDQKVGKVCAEGAAGSFCLLPKHVDFASALVPGLLWFEDDSGREVFLAVGRGLLAKVGQEVRVATGQAVRGERLEEVRQAVENEILQHDQREAQTRGAIEKMRADFLQRFVELQIHE